LLEIELAYAHKPQIKSLTSQQIPAEIEQAKVRSQTREREKEEFMKIFRIY